MVKYVRNPIILFSNARSYVHEIMFSARSYVHEERFCEYQNVNGETFSARSLCSWRKVQWKNLFTLKWGMIQCRNMSMIKSSKWWKLLKMQYSIILHSEPPLNKRTSSFMRHENSETLSYTSRVIFSFHAAIVWLCHIVSCQSSFEVYGDVLEKFVFLYDSIMRSFFLSMHDYQGPLL